MQSLAGVESVSISTVTVAGHASCARNAARWAVAATLLFVIRAAAFGPGVTPSLGALIGIDNSEALGPIPSSRIDLIDIALLAAIATAMTMTLVSWLRRPRS